MPPLHVNTAYRQPFSCFSMMDDLLREYLKLFKSPPPSTRTPSWHTKTHFQHFCFQSAAPEVRRTHSRVALQIPTTGGRRQPSGVALVSLTKTRCVGSVVFLSSLFTSRNGVKPFHNADYCLSTMREGIYQSFQGVGADNNNEPVNGFLKHTCECYSMTKPHVCRSNQTINVELLSWHFSSHIMISDAWPIVYPATVSTHSLAPDCSWPKCEREIWSNFLIETNWVLCYHSFFSIFPMNLLSCWFTKPDHRAVSALEKGQPPSTLLLVRPHVDTTLSTHLLLSVSAHAKYPTPAAEGSYT